MTEIQRLHRPLALLIYPNVYEFALFDLYLKPYGLMRLHAMLLEAGWEVKLINSLEHAPGKIKANGTGKFLRTVVEKPEALKNIPRNFACYGIGPAELERRMSEHSPAAVFISTGMTYWYKGSVEAAEISRRLWPDVPVITGGVYASLMPEHCAAVTGSDFVNTGTAGAELDLWLRGRGLPGISGTSGLLPSDGTIWENSAIVNLNSGCPLRCDYCASFRLTDGFHKGNPDAAVEWVKMINKLHGTTNFAFYDDALLFRSGDVLKPFLESIIKESEKSFVNYRFYSPNAMHIRYMDAEAASLMKKAGFQEVRLGFESSSDDFHENHDRKFGIQDFYDRIKMLTDAGFERTQIIVYLLAGMPRQKADEVEQSIRFASRTGVRLSVSEFSPVPGSPLWDECVKDCRYPIEEEPLFHNNSFFPMEWEGFTRADMQRLKVLSKKPAC